MKSLKFLLASLIFVTQGAMAAPLALKITVGGADADGYEHTDANLSITALQNVNGDTMGVIRDLFGGRAWNIPGGIWGDVECVRISDDEPNRAFIIGQVTRFDCPCGDEIDPATRRFVSMVVDDDVNGDLVSPTRMFVNTTTSLCENISISTLKAFFVNNGLYDTMTNGVVKITRFEKGKE